VPVREVNNNVADALSRRKYPPTINQTMDKLRQEETVYAMHKQTSSPPKTNEEITATKADVTDIQYVEGSNSELIFQIGKRMSYLLGHGNRNEKVHMDSQAYITMAALLQWLNKYLLNHLYEEDITWIIDNNDKVRFSIDTIRGVKANYGHSLELPELDMEKYKADMKGNKRYIVYKTYSK